MYYEDVLRVISTRPVSCALHMYSTFMLHPFPAPEASFRDFFGVGLSSFLHKMSKPYVQISIKCSVDIHAP